MASSTHTGLKLLRYVVDGALVVLVVVVLFGVFLGRVAPLTGHETFVIAGGSMEPTIHLGSVVVEENVPPEDLRVGDIVSLRSGPELDTVFTHRITRTVDRPDGWWVETKGDANQDVDPSITPFSQVIGRVAFTVPFAGYLVQWLAMPSGVLATIFIAGALLVLALIIESLEQEYAPRRRVAPVASPATSEPADPAVATVSPRRISAVLAAAREARERRTRWIAGAPVDRPSPSSKPAVGDRSIE